MKKDLDIDDNASHVEGSTTVMSAGETESDSENEPEQENGSDYPETPYIGYIEEEFGTVSTMKLSHYYFSFIKFL